MKNFKVTAKEDGKEYWISRSVAVVGIVVGLNKEGDIKSFLVSRRGPGCPDFVGSWACTCGYLDWNETTEEAVIRELKEELGLEIKDKDFRILWEIVTDPNKDPKQNIIFRYVISKPQEELEEFVRTFNPDTKSRGGEENEVDEVKLVNVTEFNDYSWAFNHDKVMLNVYEYFKTLF